MLDLPLLPLFLPIFIPFWPHWPGAAPPVRQSPLPQGLCCHCAPQWGPFMAQGCPAGSCSFTRPFRCQSNRGLLCTSWSIPQHCQGAMCSPSPCRTEVFFILFFTLKQARPSVYDLFPAWKGLLAVHSQRLEECLAHAGIQ